LPQNHESVIGAGYSYGAAGKRGLAANNDKIRDRDLLMEKP
jgi:hypothetical protein